MAEINADSRLIAAESISVHGPTRPRLDRVDITVSSGRVHAIIGPNGSGKSTLLAVLAGELRPDTGSITHAGQHGIKLSARQAAQRRALLAQSTPMAFPFRVDDVVSWGRLPWRGTPNQADDASAIAQAVRSTQIGHLMNRRITELSGGEQARVHLARVLAQGAALLLLDEADATLDVAGQAELDEVIAQRREAGDGIVLVSHDLSRISTLADDVTVLVDGRCLAQGSVASTFTDAVLSQAFSVPMQVTTTASGRFVHRRPTTSSG